MTAASPNLASLPDLDRHTLEAWLVDFDQSWHPERLAARVRELPSDSTLRRAALVEMVKIDLERQWQLGRQVGVEDYLRRYPELGTTDTAPADLLWTEYEVRQQAGATAELADFAQRFPQQADRLRHLIGLASGAAATMSHATQTAPPASPLLGGEGPAAAGGALPEQFGRYRILKRLGHGGMGAVYLATDSQLDRQVALKVPRFTPDDGPEVRERFYREARSAATIEHPNICPVYDVGEIDGTPYLTMAHIEGRPLAERIRGHQPLPQDEAVGIVRTLALALQEAHAHGVIHRDLKPSNVMLNRRGDPIVMDFGLARRLGKEEVRLTFSGAVLGTPAYMPPEQVAGQLDAIGPRCDIYSLGVILYELLTGRLPFPGPGLAVLGQILTQEPEPPLNHRPDLDPALAAVCLKALAKQPADRYPTMAAFAAALTPFLSQNRPVAAGQSTFPPRRTWRGAWIAGAAAALVLLGTILYVSTDNGTIKIEVTDPDAKVEIKVDGESIDITGLDQPLRLKAGKHGLVITGKDYETVSESFTVRRGKNPVLQVDLVRAETVTVATAERPNPLAEGFRSLFNGKDLTGWVVDGPDAKAWQVVQGELVATGEGHWKNQTYLLSEREYTDYVLRFEFQIFRGAGSGVAIRAGPGETHTSARRYLTVDIMDESKSRPPTKSKTGALNWSVAASDVILPPDRPVPLEPFGSWHTMELRLRGTSLRVWVDGQEVLSTPLNKFAAMPKAFASLKSLKGRVGFQAYFGQVRFRNIEIKELDPEPARLLPSEGYTSLFNGKDLTGWKTLPGRPKPWRVADGVILGSGAMGYLFHERGDFADFHLRVEARINAGGGSAVFYRTDFAPDRTDQWGTPLGLLTSISGSPPGKGDATGALYEFARGRGQNGVVNLMAKGHDQWTLPGAWFTLEVLARGYRVTTVVDGHTVADHTFTINRRRGHIALQQHDSKSVVEFRKVEIKELDPP